MLRKLHISSKLWSLFIFSNTPWPSLSLSKAQNVQPFRESENSNLLNSKLGQVPLFSVVIVMLLRIVSNFVFPMWLIRTVATSAQRLRFPADMLQDFPQIWEVTIENGRG